MITELAPAKINLFLNVVSKRQDGYHNLDMVMCPISLHDTLTFTSIPSNSIEVISSKIITSNTEDNTVYKIATHLHNEFQIKTGVSITIDKQIPLAAGLAGGSADGAATLRGLNRLWNLNLSLEELANIGLMFGSDIPFCIYNKLAVATGQGEQLSFIEKQLEIPLLLVNPNIHVSTKSVFGQVKKDQIRSQNMTPLLHAIESKSIKEIGKNLYNFLETVTFQLHPELNLLKQTIEQHHPDGILMSGSGATIFVIDSNQETLQTIRNGLPKSYFTVLSKTA